MGKLIKRVKTISHISQLDGPQDGLLSDIQWSNLSSDYSEAVPMGPMIPVPQDGILCPLKESPVVHKGPAGTLHPKAPLLTACSCSSQVCSQT